MGFSGRLLIDFSLPAQRVVCNLILLDKGLILGMITVLIEVICHNARYANNRYYESDCLSKHVSIKVEGVN